jgi:hypothetical protein
VRLSAVDSVNASKQGDKQMDYMTDMVEYESAYFLTANTAESLASALYNDGDGFCGNITEFIPAPTEDNNWLYDYEAQQFHGQFMTDENLTFDFSIKNEGEDWIISYSASH